MKNIYFAVLFLISSSSFAQNYVPMPDSGGVWINKWQEYYYNGMWVEYYTPYYTSYCTHGEDTIINMQNYFKLDTCQGGYKGAMRNDNGKVWWIPADSTQEYLAYDFTVQTGDTIYDVFIEDFWGTVGLHDIIVQQPNAVDSIQINGNWQTTIQLQGAEWIEGIGSSTGLFAEYWPNVSNYFVDLACHSVNDTTMYPNYSSQEGCNWQTIGYREESDMEFRFYPNPVTSRLYIEFSEASGSTIRILDYQGKILLEMKAHNATASIDVSELKSGVYLLEIVSGKGRSISRFVKE